MLHQSDFNKDVRNFHSTKDPENFWAKSKALYLNQIDKEIQEKYIWRRIACGALALCFLLAAGNVYLSTNTFIKTYVIEMDKSTGRVLNVGLAQAGEFTPNENVVKSSIGQFVEKTRSVPLDPLLYDKNWKEAKASMTDSAASKMAQVMSNDNDMNNAMGKKTILPKIIVIVPVTKDTYQCRWTEEHFQLNGTGQKENRIMTGVFTVEFGKPNEQDILINPLGLRIKDFSWSPEKK